jgi:hypothetical protein
MKFRPLHDRVVIKRIEAEEKTSGGILIPDTAKEKPQQGEGRAPMVALGDRCDGAGSQAGRSEVLAARDRGSQAASRPLFWRAMPPSKKIAAARKAAKLRRWRASLLRGRAQPLGTVEAPDERAAEAAAAKRFGLSNEQRRRLALRAEDAE